MAGEINKLIPQYGELNRIYNDWVTNYAFSFDKQKFITDFYRQHNDTKAFEGIDRPLGIATYELDEVLKKTLAEKLPSIEDIENAIEE